MVIFTHLLSIFDLCTQSMTAHLTLSNPLKITVPHVTADNPHSNETFVPDTDTNTPRRGNTLCSSTTQGSAGQRDSSTPQKHITSLSAPSFCWHSHSFAKLLSASHCKIHC